MFTPERIATAHALFKNTLMEALGIRLVPSEEGTIAATMPVEPRTHQPMGFLHGGATAALAESLGSVGSYLLVHEEGRSVLGVEVNANHLRAVRSGLVKATGRLLHHGRRSHVWDIRVTDEQDRLVAVCRLTNMIIDREG